MLYALGVGAGQTDPTGFELEFTTENSQDVKQRVLPTFPVIVGMAGGGGMPSFGDINWAMLVHGEQRVENFGEIPVDGTIVSTTRVVGIYDKGSGALGRHGDRVEVQGQRQARVQHAVRARSSAAKAASARAGATSSRPGRRSRSAKPDHEVTYATRADQALLYRLSGDRNPLHSDPSFAKLAGFPKPILHGLCTYGVTGRALLHALCGSDPAKFKIMDARFSKPVMPGDELTVKMWNDGSGKALFQTVTQDGVVVIDGGASIR